MKIAALTSKVLILAAFTGSVCAPAQARMIAGHLEQNCTAIAGDTSLAGGAIQSAAIHANSFPETYEGVWRCETVVTDSAVQSIMPGQKVVCEVNFVKDASGKVQSVWNQDGWSEGQSSVTCFNAKEAQMDRTSYQTSNGQDGMWAARAKGNFTQINGAAIIARSVVDQYIDGQYVGRYHTTSILRRENPLEGVAASGEEPRDFIDQQNALPFQFEGR
ncbi:MAG TPA: hypothetical protein V6C97_04770 [Oculatellaceae cyanobacterium]